MRAPLLRTLMILFAFLIALAFCISACSSGDDDDTGRAGDDDSGDDDSGDDDSGDDDDDDDCENISENPYCLVGNTYEFDILTGVNTIPGAPIWDFLQEVVDMENIRHIFLRFDQFNQEETEFDVTGAAGLLSNPTQPDTDYTFEATADFATNPTFEIGPITFTWPAEFEGPIEVPLGDVNMSGIFDLDGSAFRFGIFEFGIAGSWFQDNFGIDVCGEFPDLCQNNGVFIRMENYEGMLRTDAAW